MNKICSEVMIETLKIYRKYNENIPQEMTFLLFCDIRVNMLSVSMMRYYFYL